MPPHDASKCAKLDRVNRALIQGQKQAHDVGSVDAASEEFLHEGFGFRASEEFEALGFIDQWEKGIHAVSERMLLNLARDEGLK